MTSRGGTLRVRLMDCRSQASKWASLCSLTLSNSTLHSCRGTRGSTTAESKSCTVPAASSDTTQHPGPPAILSSHSCFAVVDHSLALFLLGMTSACTAAPLQNSRSASTMSSYSKYGLPHPAPPSVGGPIGCMTRLRKCLNLSRGAPTGCRCHVST